MMIARNSIINELYGLLKTSLLDRLGYGRLQQQQGVSVRQRIKFYQCLGLKLMFEIF